MQLLNPLGQGMHWSVPAMAKVVSEHGSIKMGGTEMHPGPPRIVVDFADVELLLVELELAE